MLDRRARQDQRVAAQNVINVGALLRQHIDPRQIAGGAGEALLDARSVDDQYRVPAERVEPLPQQPGLGLGDMGGVDDDQLAFAVLGRQRGLEAEPADLLLQAEFVAAHDRSEDARAAAELRRAQAALTGAPGALLPVGLARGAADIADPLGLVGSGAALGELPVDDARKNVAAHRQPEHLVGEFDVADLLVVEIAYGMLHQDASAGLVAGPGASRNAAGNGTPAGRGRFLASLTSTKPPWLPGTEPSIINSPRSASAATTRRLCVVTRSAPRWPAIFLFLNVLPGDCRCPVEPRLRCETDTPWL